MQKFDHPDEQMLGAFVDGQLDDANCERVIEAMERDPQIREQVYQLRRAKDLLRLSFGGAQPPARDRSTARSWWRRYSFAVAASLSIVTVGATAWTVGYYYSPQHFSASGPALAGVAQQQARRVVLHITESNPRQFDAALDYVERFLQKEEGQGGQIEVVANAGGLDLMRVGVSPYEQRIKNMLANHSNVHFLACANALHKLEEQGVTANVIANIDTHQSAVDRIVERLQGGWNYVKVESLTEL